MSMVSLVKSLHVLSATIFFGAGLMSAFWKVRADRTSDARVITWAQRQIVLADWVFTVPSGVVSPLTGAWLVSLYGLPFSTPWVRYSLGGYVLAMVLWLPAAWLQLELRKLAEASQKQGVALPERFTLLNRLWLALGVPAFAASLFIIWAMVAKPS